MNWDGLERHEVALKLPLLVIKAAGGVLACGYLNVQTFEKTGEAGAIVTGVRTFDDMKKAAQSLGMRPDDWLRGGARPISDAEVVASANLINEQSQIAVQAGVTLAFQWRRNGVLLEDGSLVSGAHTRTLTFGPVRSEDAGVYDVVVSSLSGGAEKNRVTARTTLVQVLQPPVIGFADVVARPGQQVVLAPSVKSTALGGVTYQWAFKGAVIQGETGPQYKLSSVNASNAGKYTVTVSDLATATLQATELSALGGKTSGVVTVSNAVTISGTASELKAALVTPDRLLARRVAAELRRFDIEIDDSGGASLASTMPKKFGS